MRARNAHQGRFRLAAALTVLCVSGSLSEAGSQRQSSDQAQSGLAQLETAAADCFAEAVLSNPAALAHARAGRWYQAAGVSGVICRRDVARMIEARDAMQGPGTGERFFRTVYVRHLDRTLAARLRPWLDQQSFAKVEAPADLPPSGCPNSKVVHCRSVTAPNL